MSASWRKRPSTLVKMRKNFSMIAFICPEIRHRWYERESDGGFHPAPLKKF